MLGREHDEGHIHGRVAHDRVDYVALAQNIIFGDALPGDGPGTGDPSDLALFLRQHEGDISTATDCEGCVNEWDSIALLAVRSDNAEMFQEVLEYKHFIKNWHMLGSVVAAHGVPDMIQLFLVIAGDKADVEDMKECAARSENKDALPRLMYLLQ